MPARKITKSASGIETAGPKAAQPVPVAAPAPAPPSPAHAGWTFFTNHAHVLVCLAADPEQTLRAVADRVGITERAVQGIVADLVEAGVLTREREGRRNRYTIDPTRPLRHPIEAHRTIGDVLAVITGGK
jgi:hypothetical protein